MKAILEFDLPDEKEEFNQAAKAGSLVSALDEIKNSIFRPARKHGYEDPTMRELLAKLPNGEGEDIIGRLEELFYKILEEHNVSEL